MQNWDHDNNNDNVEYQEHERTYQLFITLIQWGAAVVVLVLVFMAVFLL